MYVYMKYMGICVQLIDKIINNLEKCEKNSSLGVLFIVIFGFLSILFIVLGILTEGTTFHVFFADRNDSFMDYFNSVMYSSDLPYSKYTIIYPPLITIIYGIIGNFTIPDIVNDFGPTIAHNLRNSQMGLMSFCFVSFVSFILLNNFLKKLCYDKSICSMLSLLLISSYPVIFSLERGNCIIISIVFLLFFLNNYQSKSKWLRILSYLCLAISMGIKIYTILFSLLILRERDYKGFIICYSVTIIAFFIPFIFTDGNIYSLVHNIFGYVGGTSETRSFMDIKSVLGYLNSFISEKTRYMLQYMLLGALYLSTLIIVWFSSISKWKVLTLLCVAVSIGMGTGAIYNLAFYLIPLTVFIFEEKELNKENIFYLILFILILSWIPCVPQYSKVIESIHTLPQFIFATLIIVEGWKNIFQNKLIDNIKKVRNSDFKNILPTLVLSTLIVVVSFAPSLTPERGYAEITNNGDNVIEKYEEDNKIYFSYDCTSGLFKCPLSQSIWKSNVVEYIITTENGFIGSNEVMYVNSMGNIVGYHFSTGVTGWLGQGEVKIICDDGPEIVWHYEDYLFIPSVDGSYTYFSTTNLPEPIFTNGIDNLYSTGYCDKNNAILSLNGNKIKLNGIETPATISLKNEKTGYMGVYKMNSSIESTSILISDGEDTHITNYIVPLKIIAQKELSTKEKAFLQYAIMSLLIMCGIGIVFIMFISKGENNEQNKC